MFSLAPLQERRLILARMNEEAEERHKADLKDKKKRTASQGKKKKDLWEKHVLMYIQSYVGKGERF